MMSYALIPLTPVWCEVNVLSLSLFILFSSFCYCLSSSYLFSNTIRPRMNIQKL